MCNQPEYQSLPPSQIVPRLADEGEYPASESSFLSRAARSESASSARLNPGAVHGGQAARLPGHRPESGVGLGYTFLISSLRSAFYRLYLVLDIFNRKIIGREAHENESAEHASMLIRKACLA